MTTRLLNKYLLSAVLCSCVVGISTAQTRQRGWDYQKQNSWLKTQQFKGGPSAFANCSADATSRRDAVLNGNRITSQILNFGSISSPGNTITDIVWNGLGYGYEFGPFVAAEIIDEGHVEQKSVMLRDENGVES